MRLARVLTTLLFVSASSLFAQEVTPTGLSASRSTSAGLSITPDTYGTASQWLALSAWDFQPLGSSDTFAWVSSPGALGRYSTGTGLLAGPLHFPEGALLTAFEFQACDSNATSDVFFYLDTISKASSTYTEVLLTKTSGSAGCSLIPYTLPTPITIDNANKTYFLLPQFGATGTSLVLQSARASYKLQISPDPTGATFTDVPVGHPQHRFVEALVAAGITGGCGGNNYCPDAPVTRGQMAVFLAGALGLHWAP